jgi:hypothetical protein
MVCDPIELYEARLLEMPFKDDKIDFPNVDFRTLLISSISIQKAFKVSKKIIKFNKI